MSFLIIVCWMVGNTSLVQIKIQNASTVGELGDPAVYNVANEKEIWTPVRPV